MHLNNNKHAPKQQKACTQTTKSMHLNNKKHAPKQQKACTPTTKSMHPNNKKHAHKQQKHAPKQQKHAPKQQKACTQTTTKQTHAKKEIKTLRESRSCIMVYLLFISGHQCELSSCDQ